MTVVKKSPRYDLDRFITTSNFGSHAVINWTDLDPLAPTASLIIKKYTNIWSVKLIANSVKFPSLDKNVDESEMLEWLLTWLQDKPPISSIEYYHKHNWWRSRWENINY